MRLIPLLAAASPPAAPGLPVVPIIVTAVVSITVCVLGILAKRALTRSEERKNSIDADARQVEARDQIFGASKHTIENVLSHVDRLQREISELRSIIVALQLRQDTLVNERDDYRDRAEFLERMVRALGGDPSGAVMQDGFVERIRALERMVRDRGGDPSPPPPTPVP